MPHARFVDVAVATLGVIVPSAAAQCPETGAGFHVAGTDRAISELAVVDLGSGPVLAVGGEFEIAGDAMSRRVALWDGASWQGLGNGLDVAPYALASFHDNGSPILAAGGLFGLRGWDGAQWTAFGGALSPPSSGVFALQVHDDGSGPALYAGGVFTGIGGLVADGLARWNGSSWSALPPYGWAYVQVMAEFDDGSGNALYVGGRTSLNQSVVARWDGTAWSTIGTTPEIAPFLAMAAHDDGGGPALYVTGAFSSFDNVPAQRVARFDGAGWSAVGEGHAEVARALSVFDDGTGSKLFAGTVETGYLLRWDGASWEPVAQPTDYAVNGLAVFDDGAGPALWAGGDFHVAGTQSVSNLAGWDGAGWRTPGPQGDGIVDSFAPSVLALEVLDDGTGEALYAGGSFLSAGGSSSRSVARFDGADWQGLGSGIDGTVRDVEAFGGSIYVCGNFVEAGGVEARHVARWDGVAWSPLDTGLFLPGVAEGRALEVFDDGGGPALYVAGHFQNAGGLFSRSLARWDGTSWSAIGVESGAIDDLATFDDGSGPALFAIGLFEVSPGAGSTRFAKWTSSGWSVLAPTVGGSFRTLDVIDLGTGPRLFLGGNMNSPLLGGAFRVLEWTSAGWIALPNGPLDEVFAIEAFDLGGGPELYVSAQIEFEHGVAKWDGSAWTTILDGFTNATRPTELEAFADGLGPAGSLYLGGRFVTLGGRASIGLGRWNDPCACGGQSYCTSGTTTHGCTPTMTSTGRASASASSSFVLTATQLEGDKSGHLFYGLSGPHSAPWGQSTHYLCVKAPSQRTGTTVTGGTAGQCDGAMALDWNGYVAANPGALGVPFTAGTQVWAQAYFRDPPNPKTTALSDGLRFTLCP